MLEPISGASTAGIYLSKVRVLDVSVTGTGVNCSELAVHTK